MEQHRSELLGHHHDGRVAGDHPRHPRARRARREAGAPRHARARQRERGELGAAPCHAPRVRGRRLPGAHLGHFRGPEAHRECITHLQRHGAYQ